MPSKDAVERQKPLVLITRPTGQQLAFSDGCKKLGFSVALLPCLQIIPCPQHSTRLDALLQYHDTALFTSANAVRFAHRIRPFPWPMKVHAIGAATAQVLDQYKQALSLIPQAPFNSEAYLEQVLEQPRDSVLIVKGRGGRNLIELTLAAHDWKVSTIDVYERIRPDISANEVAALFTDFAPDVISVTSDEVLTNLWHLCRNHRAMLRTIPLVVNSQRCVALAIKLGFQNTIRVATPAGDQGQLSCLANWKENECEND